ncbi:MAG: hypothetical protein JO254_15435 [Pseudolabrys sp.]|nr:hypothetical protein [Pseudolabrys sp.]
MAAPAGVADLEQQIGGLVIHHTTTLKPTKGRINNAISPNVTAININKSQSAHFQPGRRSLG